MATGERSALDAELLAVFCRGVAGGFDERAFNDLALRLFRYQARANRPYGVFCERKGVRLQDVRCWEDIPALPVAAFKRERVADHPPSETVHVFETSGTTTGSAGRVYLDSLALYDASALAAFKAFMIPDCERIAMASLTVPPEFAVSSSLIYMLNRAVQAFGAAGSRFFGSPQGLLVEELISWLARGGEPVLLCGTAVGFLNLFESLGRRALRLKLPPRSRILETGGFKGRIRGLDAASYDAMFPEWLGVDPAFVVSEYGMTEMASQFYDGHLCVGTVPQSGSPSGGDSPFPRVKAGPPWVRTRVVSPRTGEPLGEGEEGILVHCDLANRSSVAMLETRDLGRRLAAGFELTGRVLGSEPRGCSLRDEALVGHEDRR